MSIFSFIIDMFRSRCMEPGCPNKGTNYPHGIPCCDEHFHEGDCVVWLGDDCDCGKEVGSS